MINTEETIKAQIKALAMVVYSMMFGLFLFAAVSYFVIGQSAISITDTQSATNVSVGSLILAIVVVMLANGFLKYKLAGLQKSSGALDENLKQHRTAYFIYLAMVEAVGIIGIICFLLTGKSVALIAPGMSIVQMFLHRPTNQKIISLVG